MYNINNRNLVSCAVIKVEAEQEYHFKVNIQDILGATALIEDILTSYNIPYSRVYLTGYLLASENEVCSLERISEILNRFANEKQISKVKVAKR